VARTNIIIGIDYSMVCPSVCAYNGTDSSWYVNYKKPGLPYPNLPNVYFTRSYEDKEIPRYIELANWVVSIVQQHVVSFIVLEDYAFGANGRLTQLSENAGTLKVKLYENCPSIPLHVVAPTTMKKFATGKGTATKDIVWESFVKEYPLATSWPSICHPRAEKIHSPLSDIADSYFLAKYGEHHYAIN